jgi:hypothetical protein
MASLQYVIDSICSKLTVEWMFRMIRARLDRGPFDIGEVIPVIQSEDRSLDRDSAKMLAEAAVADMALRHEARIEGDRVFSAVYASIESPSGSDAPG